MRCKKASDQTKKAKQSQKESCIFSVYVTFQTDLLYFSITYSKHTKKKQSKYFIVFFPIHLGISCMVSFGHFNIISGFCLDYMHCVTIGVVRNLVEFCSSSKNSKQQFHMTKKKQIILNRRLLSVKPTMEISRRPRSLDEIAHFKANEFRTLLLYYLPICLEDLLPKKFIDHLRLLSFSIYTLLKDEITPEELELCEKKLNRFVSLYQQYYGEENMTMNVHLITHIVESVKNAGPLWAQSAFAFESYNGRLLKYVNGNTDVLCQITTKYIFGRAMKQTERRFTDNIRFLGRMVNLKIDGVEYSHVFKRIQVGLVTYTSMYYTRAKKTVDYFMCLKNGDVGAVRYYFQYENKTYFSFARYEKIEKLEQFTEISSTGINVTALAENIGHKLICIQLHSKTFVTKKPNNFEKD